MPQPMTTARALAGKALLMALLLCRGGGWSEDGADRALERFDVVAHHGLGAGRVAVVDRLQQVGVLGDGVVEPGDAVEREEPDPQRQGVVLVERRLDERVVGTALDVAMDALVELDQRPLVARVGEAGQLGEEGAGDLAVVGVRTLGGEARSEALERDSRFREEREVADVDRGDDDAAPRIDLDELLLRERAQRLPHRCAPESEPLHQLALADRGTRCELEGDDQLPDAVVGALTERQRPVGLGREEGTRGGRQS